MSNTKQKSMKEYRTWGFFEVIAENEAFKVKRILIKPGHKLSLQSHEKRSEHWVIVQGVATITIDAVVKDYGYDQPVFIRREQKHRIENKTNGDVQVIEVQCGDYFGEDDIIRYNDDYSQILV